MSNSHLLEVVGRGSETQLQVGENSNKLPQRDKGLSRKIRGEMNIKLAKLLQLHSFQIVHI